jgi:hypothetical protein
MEKGSIKKKGACACRDQFPVASQQNIAKHFSVLWDNPIWRRCIGEKLNEIISGKI